MLAISALDIFELVQQKIPDVTPDEINYTIMQSLPYMGGESQTGVRLQRPRSKRY